MEHPEDRKRAPYPSIWNTTVVTSLEEEFGANRAEFDQ